MLLWLLFRLFHDLVKVHPAQVLTIRLHGHRPVFDEQLPIKLELCAKANTIRQLLLTRKRLSVDDGSCRRLHVEAVEQIRLLVEHV